MKSYPWRLYTRHVTEPKTSISKCFLNVAVMLQNCQQLPGRNKAMLKGENNSAQSGNHLKIADYCTFRCALLHIIIYAQLYC